MLYKRVISSFERKSLEIEKKYDAFFKKKVLKSANASSKMSEKLRK